MRFWDFATIQLSGMPTLSIASIATSRTFWHSSAALASRHRRMVTVAPGRGGLDWGEEVKAIAHHASDRSKPPESAGGPLNRKRFLSQIQMQTPSGLSDARHSSAPETGATPPSGLKASGLNSLPVAFWLCPAAFGQQDVPVLRGFPEELAAPPCTLLPEPSPRSCMLVPALV